MQDRVDGADRSRTASFGYHVRRRRLALDLTQAALAQRVGCSTATIKKIEHDQRRPSRRMAERLADSLELTEEERPALVAVALAERSARSLAPGGPTSQAVADRWSVPGHGGLEPGPMPEWLVRAARLTSPELGGSVVGRDAELAWLERHLHAAVAGEGRVVFVTGEAGQGKTTLLTAFAAQAHETVPELVGAAGYGTAATGLGDPYLPFRDLLLMLLADPQARWQADRTHHGQAERLWRFAPSVARTLLDAAPQLVDVLVPAATVHERAGTPPSTLRAGDGTTGGLPRGQMFGQFTGLLHALSQHRPLLLTLDDLQWADVASAELLFHLARRLRHSRVLVVGAYRDSEVATGVGAAGETLRRLRLEVGRDLEDATLDLEGVATDAARQLCDALVDREPNRLGEEFRRRLFAQTRGHPLFTLELLHELRRRGDLALDAGGLWLASDTLDWHALPGRVAAVVEQRLGRLDEEVRAVLDVAAVVGEQFTAEVVADVSGMDGGGLLRLLSSELAGVHGLVREAGMQRLGARELATWRFSHVLFQHYLYDRLGEGQRRHLHHEVAAAFAALHGGDDEVVPLLAYHYAQSGEAELAVPHLLRAGDRARGLYATDEATHHYRRAVEFLRDRRDDERLARTLMKLGLTRQTAFDHDAAQRAYDEAFRLWRRSWSGQAAPEATETLRMLWREPESLDPTMGGYNLTAPVTTQLFSGLVAFGEEGEILPDVAERWELEDSGRRYVFHLRDDVCWSDGVPVTAEDFVFTYRRALDPATKAITASSLLDAVRGARAVRGGAPIETVALGIEAVDEQTLVIELEEPTSYFIQNLAYYVLLPVPRHVVEAHGTAWATPERLVSNGPFLVTSWAPGSAMTLERNPRYHGTTVGNVHRVELALDVPEDQHEAIYAADELDVVRDWFTPAPAVASLSRQFPSDHLVRPEHTTVCCLLNHRRAPLDDRRVRRALALAIDRDALLAIYPPGAAVPATGGIVPPGMPGHVSAVQPSFDPDEAARLLDEAAVAAGAELTVHVPTRGQRLAEALVGAWEAVGLACRVELDDAGPADEEAPWHVSAGGWVADYADPDNFLRVFVGLSLDDPPEGYSELLRQAALCADQSERLALYEQAERLLARETVLIPLVHRSTTLLLKPWVQRFVTPAVKHVGFWKDVTVAGRQG